MGMTDKKRIRWIDYAKAFAMLLVVIGHVSYGNGLTNWLYSFHMPLFFFLSGVTLKKRGGYTAHLAKRLLIPYFLYVLLYFLYDGLQNVVLGKTIDLGKEFLGIFVQMRGTPFSIGLWFLPLLFLSEMIAYTLIHQKKATQYLGIFALMLISFSYAITVRQVLPWGADAAPIAAVFIWCGYQYQCSVNLKEPLKGHIPYITAVICIGAFVINLLAGGVNTFISGQCVDMHKMMYGDPLLYLIAAFSGIFFVVTVSQLLSKRPWHFAQFIGKNTLHIYCLHGLVLAVIKKAWEIVCRLDEFGNISVYEQVMIAVAAIIICAAIIQVSNTFWRLIVGSQ